MKALYGDILSRIAEPPKWWDENGVPRYDEFNPDDTPSIYAREAVLYRVECQQCGRPFDVAEDWSIGRAVLLVTDSNLQDAIERSSLSWRTRQGLLHYGDPPRHGGECTAGDTMNSVPRQVLQFWRKGELMAWERVTELEGVDLTPEWAER